MIIAMWLLNTHTLGLEAFLSRIPEYAILSHRWEETEELSFGNVTAEQQHLKGYQKVAAFCVQARSHNFRYVWVDTCCIDKKSSAELGEAINSMYTWYKQAAVCFVYLYDVEGRDDINQSSWFTRGWTLQELIAPTKLYFYDSKWSPIASKHEISAELEAITGIPQDALQNFRHDDFCTAEKMAWAARRTTTREEDSAYCLLGLFNVNMPLLYGEGSKAFLRLQEEIMRTSTDLSILLWQGHASTMNGLLAAAPSCFAKLGDGHAALLRRQNLFNISQGWTTNNAGIRIQLTADPYLLSHDSKKIFCVHIHEPFRTSVYGIFLEQLSGDWASWTTPSYRRVTVEDKAWIDLSACSLAIHGLSQQLFITRQALVDYSTNGMRRCTIAIKLPPSATCTARSGSLADNYRALLDWPTSFTAARGKVEYGFDIEPLAAVGLFGQIVITLAPGVDILVCCGHDRTFRAICLVLPFCTDLYEQGLEAYNLLVGFNALCSESDRDESYWDEACGFSAISSKGMLIESSRELDEIGIYLGVDGSELSDLYSAELHLDGEKFLQHYFPDLGERSCSEKKAFIQKRSVTLQHQLDAPRRDLFRFYGTRITS
jgi:hypothetical protein